MKVVAMTKNRIMKSLCGEISNRQDLSSIEFKDYFRDERFDS